jgi:hypothetical protein
MERSFPGILSVKLPPVLVQCFLFTLDEDPENRMQFADLLLLLRSKAGATIKDMQLGSLGTRLQFDEVEADFRELMPSSRYVHHGDYEESESRGNNMFSKIR